MNDFNFLNLFGQQLKNVYFKILIRYKVREKAILEPVTRESLVVLTYYLN